MGALSTLASTPNILPPQDAELAAFLSQIQQTARNYKSALWEIAYLAPKIRVKMGGGVGNTGDLWPTIGFESEDEFREWLGIPRSTFYAWTAVGLALSNLPLAEMRLIKPTNATLLTQVDPSITGDYPWVEEAKTLSSHEFGLRVAQRNKQAGSEKEVTTYFKVKVPITAKKFLEETVEKFRVEHELASSGEALEMLIADVHDRPNAMTTMKTAHDLILWAMGRVKARWPESKEVQWLYQAQRMLYKTYSAVRFERDEEDAQEVYPAENLYRNHPRPTGAGIVSTKPYGADDPPKPGRPVMEEPSGYLHPLLAPDEFDGNDDGFEDGER